MILRGKYMPKFVDYSFIPDNFNKASKLSEKEVLVYTFRNLLLSIPGNYPEMPGFGVNIAKYNLSIANKQTLDAIKDNIVAQTARYLPELSDLDVSVQFRDSDDPLDRRKYLTISISVTKNETSITTNFIIFKNENEETVILNESY
jgi:hypothetical protein